MKDTKQNKYPERWDDIEFIEGYYVNNNSFIEYQGFLETSIKQENVFKTEEQAKASIALAKLTQLVYVFNKDCKQDYNIYDVKYYIRFYDNNLHIECNATDKYSCFLAFNTPEKARLFINMYKNLIIEAKCFL